MRSLQSLAILKLLGEGESILYSSSIVQLSKNVCRNREVFHFLKCKLARYY